MKAPTYFSPAELVKRWGGRVSEKTLANWRSMKRGPLPSKLGGRVVYNLVDVEAYEQLQREFPKAAR